MGVLDIRHVSFPLMSRGCGVSFPLDVIHLLVVRTLVPLEYVTLYKWVLLCAAAVPACSLLLLSDVAQIAGSLFHQCGRGFIGWGWYFGPVEVRVGPSTCSPSRALCVAWFPVKVWLQGIGV